MDSAGERDHSVRDGWQASKEGVVCDRVQFPPEEISAGVQDHSFREEVAYRINAATIEGGEMDVKAERERKKRVRMERNREAAKRSRIRQKEYIAELNERLARFEQEKKQLMMKANVLKETISSLPPEFLPQREAVESGLDKVSSEDKE
mmetsp:Transcript_1379/g.2825  ORF Transcript_1379/g.2825 Transcript_1379/m.2825 type:complete len:149 (-) Transcript_1379:240-686(-)|eukprot:CAMPEP_0184685814 /NCGR_PEP_ID=MMETSP0312-20130426/20324_1 /TAXON_ID=31354 /ORGANISM="Compsopogon coeruleus, Strain SAG 36.94" /LENGTH=148 /DNA_ID=CAMNT_0027140291 /DNA_START=154 /DNA_END=600 /DNA_ORIENTATION=-